MVIFRKGGSSKWKSMSPCCIETVDPFSPEETPTCMMEIKFKCVTDGIVKDDTVKTIQLDPSKAQLLHDIKLKDNLDIKTIREFIKTSYDQ